MFTLVHFQFNNVYAIGWGSTCLQRQVIGILAKAIFITLACCHYKNANASNCVYTCLGSLDDVFILPKEPRKVWPMWLPLAFLPKKGQCKLFPKAIFTSAYCHGQIKNASNCSYACLDSGDAATTNRIMSKESGQVASLLRFHRRQCCKNRQCKQILTLSRSCTIFILFLFIYFVLFSFLFLDTFWAVFYRILQRLLHLPASPGTRHVWPGVHVIKRFIRHRRKEQSKLECSSPVSF